MGRANPSIIPEIDALIIESTYALKNHPSRNDIERKFVENVIEWIMSGPHFFVGTPFYKTPNEIC